jgi:hypothetical protein
MPAGGSGDATRVPPIVQPSPFLAGGITPELLQQAGLLAMQQHQQQQLAAGMAFAVPQQQAQMGVTPGATGGGTSHPSPDVSGMSDDPTPVRQSGGGTSHARGKTARQQEANKIAQQRYRERKKAKFQDMEKQVDGLRQQLASLQAVQQRNSILEGMNNELQKTLVDREREVERLKLELDTHADASLGGGGGHANGGPGTSDVSEGEAGAAAALRPSCNSSGQIAVSCDVLPRDISGIDFESGFAEQIENLRAFLKKYDLEDAAVNAEDVPLDVMAELAGLVGTSCQLCQAAIRAEGARVLELIAGDPSSLSSAEHPASERFQAALDAMAMTPAQQDQLLLLRTAHLAKMREIYAQRQQLNMEAMRLMLPHHSRNPAEDNTLEGKMENISHYGYLPVAKSNAELAAVLDAIKDNLRREQRSAMDINCATVSRVLTPLQAAHYMVVVYPQHCDALALSNVLASQMGKEGMGEGGGGGARAIKGAGRCC